MPNPPRITEYTFDDYDLAAFLREASRFGQDRFGYVVTPNADHLIRFHDDGSFRSDYAAADYVLLDSRFLAILIRFFRGLRLGVCTGSDLTAGLFAQVVGPDDPIVLIGSSDAQAALLARRYSLRNLHHYNPPMGFITDPGAVEACLQFVEEHSPFRFCFLGIGSPQQEIVARHLKVRGAARGLAICCGAAVNFLTDIEKRAPRWLQRIGFEWLFRLLQDPRRLARRYLIRGPRVFLLLQGARIASRPRVEPAVGCETAVK